MMCTNVITNDDQPAPAFIFRWIDENGDIATLVNRKAQWVKSPARTAPSKWKEKRPNLPGIRST